jgi:hypothetical protein
MRSVVVVFPASMWAMMPMFRVRLSGVSLGISYQLSALSRQLVPFFEIPSFSPADS